MIKYFKYTFLFIIGLGFSSCEDYLSPEPTAAIPATEFFTNEVEIELGIGAIYDALQGVNSYQLNDNRAIQIEFFLTEMLSDNTSSKSPDPENAADNRQFDNYTVQENNSVSANYYSSMYRIIYLANLVIDSTNNAISDETTALTLKAEAKFLRAYAYFNLVRLYSDIDADGTTSSDSLAVPYIDHVLTADESDTQYIRATVGDIYDLIISDLLLAAESLDDSYTTRASKSAAHGLLAKAYLSLETPLYGNAIYHLDQVYGNYEILDTYSDVFSYSNELNNEIIFAIGFEDNLANDSQNFSLEFTRKGNQSGMNMLTNDLLGELVESGGSNRQLYDDFTDGSSTKYATEKFSTTTEDESQYAGFDWTVLRYADIIMMYAEAYMAGGDSVTLASPWDVDYNLIRTRAGLTTVTEVTKDELLAERRYEFFTENQRLFDLKRFGVANEVLGTFAQLSGYNYDFRECGLPIPLREINLSPKDDSGAPLLEQNSFWAN